MRLKAINAERTRMTFLRKSNDFPYNRQLSIKSCLISNYLKIHLYFFKLYMNQSDSPGFSFTNCLCPVATHSPSERSLSKVGWAVLVVTGTYWITVLRATGVSLAGSTNGCLYLPVVLK